MLWYVKQAETASATDDAEVIRPAELAVEFDGAIASEKLKRLLDGVAEFDGGLAAMTQALQAKRELMHRAFPLERPEDWTLGRDGFRIVLSAVFPARRKLEGFLSEFDADALARRAEDLVYGRGEISDRIHAFCELVPTERKKERRAARDLAAEILHFRDPEGVPLMTRWVWDKATESGALREFIRGNDGMPEIPLDNRPETYEGARSWFAGVVAEAGFYRDLPFLIDLLQAQAYVDYVKAMSKGMGMVQAEFASSQHPLEFVLKLLGVDAGVRLPASGGENGRTLH